MTPEPTPVAGMTPVLPLSEPVTVILTTAGLTFEATAIVADCSSIVTGWVAPVLVACGAEIALLGAGRSRTPAAPSTATVPTDARIAASTAVSTTDPPRRPRRGAVVGAVVETAAGRSEERR